MRHNPLTILAATSPADVVGAAVSRVAASSGQLVQNVARVATAHDAERVAAQALAAERLRRGRAAADQAPRGAVDDEPVVPLDVAGAKEAVIGMVRDLADMPPPDRKDDVGFSAATDGPLRAFLSRTGGSATHDPLDLMSPEDRAAAERDGVRPLTARDWLRAARLLLVHSKAQVPRALVLGAIRALEADARVAPLPPRPKVSDVSADDYQILGQSAVTVGELAAKGGAAKWQPWRLGGSNVKGARVLTLPGDLAQRLLADAGRDDARGKVLTTAPGLGANQVLIVAEGDGTAAAAVVRAALLDVQPDDDKLARRVAAVVEASATDAVGLDLRGALDRAKPPSAAGPAVAAGAPPKGDAFPDAPLPAGKVPANIKAGHAGPPDRYNKAAISDFDAVKWRWDGGPLVYLALSRVSSGGGWKPLDQVSNELKRMIKGEARKEARGQYSDWFYPFDVADVDDVARVMGKHYRALVAPQELKRLGAWWAYLANVPSATAGAGAAPPKRDATRGSYEGASWEYLPTQNMLQLDMPFDGARDRTNQIGAAMRGAGIVHRRVGRGGMVWMTAANTARLVDLMDAQGRQPGLARVLREMLPAWLEMEAKHAPRATKEAVQAAEAMLKRLRFTMDRADADAVFADLQRVAPWLAASKPGATSADLGPYGAWSLVSREDGGKVKEKLYVFLDGMGKGVEALSEGSHATASNGWAHIFDVSNVERLVHALDKAGLVPLAMSLRAALMVDQIDRGCAIQDDMASAGKLDDLRLPESVALTREVLDAAPAVLAPGMTLREYQAIAVAFFRVNKYRAIDGDDPGMGKTLTVLAALALDPQATLPALIIAPTSVVGVWGQEAAKFTPGLRVATARPKGSETVPEGVARALRGEWDLLVIGWDSLRLAPEELLSAADAGRWRTVVMDEAHSAKHGSSQRGQLAQKLAQKAQNVLALTGTLIENNAGEAWSILNMVAPHIYGVEDDFKRQYANQSTRGVVVVDPVTGGTRLRKIKRSANDGTDVSTDTGKSLSAVLAELRVALRCDMIRRLKDEVFSQLPPIERTLLPITLPAADMKRYAAVMGELPEWVVSAVKYDYAQRAALEMREAVRAGDAITPALALTRTRMRYATPDDREEARLVWNGTVRMTPEKEQEADRQAKMARLMVAYGGLRRLIGEMKAPAVLDQVMEYLQAHETPLVLFAEHRPVIAYFRDELERKGKRVAVVTGETPPARRDDLIAGFQNGAYDVIVGSTALRQGVTLTAADAAFFAEQWWNPAWIKQAEDRIHRTDDRTLAKKSVQIVHTFAEGTVDEQVADLLHKKRQVVNAVLGGIEGAVSTTERSVLMGILGTIEDRVVAPTDQAIRKAVDGALPSPKPLNAGRVVVAAQDDTATAPEE